MEDLKRLAKRASLRDGSRWVVGINRLTLMYVTYFIDQGKHRVIRNANNPVED